MANEQRRALLGFHRQENIDFFGADIFVPRGYIVDTATDVQGMEELIAAHQYSVCIMDINLGEDGADNYAPAQTIYGLLQASQPKTRYMAISGNPCLVREAQREGIPAGHKTHFIRTIDDFLPQD